MCMNTERVHLLMAAEDRAAYAAAAERAGVSLSEWLRGAARSRLERQQTSELRTVEQLDAFFAASDEAEGGGEEPDWEQHLAVMAESRGRGLPT